MKFKKGVRDSCETGCEYLNCYHNGHCAVDWDLTNLWQVKTTCDCSMTSYLGPACARGK